MAIDPLAPPQNPPTPAPVAPPKLFTSSSEQPSGYSPIYDANNKITGYTGAPAQQQFNQGMQQQSTGYDPSKPFDIKTNANAPVYYDPNGVLISESQRNSSDKTNQVSTSGNYTFTPNSDGTFTAKNNVTGQAVSGVTAPDEGSALSAERLKMSTDAFNKIIGYQNGSIPLTPGEQAEVDDLKRQFGSLISEQQLANKNNEGVNRIQGFRGGGEYTPGIESSRITNIISRGASKVADLTSQMSGAVAKLESAFRTDDINAVKSAYALYDTAAKDRLAEIQTQKENVAKAAKDARDYNLQVQQFKETQKQNDFANALNSDKFTYQQKQDLIDNAIKQGTLSETKRHNMELEAIQREPTAKEKADIEKALKESKLAIPAMNDKIAAVDTLINHSGLNSRVGTNILSRKASGLADIAGAGVVGAGLGAAGGAFAGGVGAIPGALVGGLIGAGSAALRGTTADLTGAGKDFAAGVHKVVSGLTLQALIDAKARGATFGALSEGELSVLANSASTINDWEVKDSSGKGTGVWDIDEADFKKELQTIQDLTRRAILLSGESATAPAEDATLKGLFPTPVEQTDPSTYY